MFFDLYKYFARYKKVETGISFQTLNYSLHFSLLSCLENHQLVNHQRERLHVTNFRQRANDVPQPDTDGIVSDRLSRKENNFRKSTREPETLLGTRLFPWIFKNYFSFVCQERSRWYEIWGASSRWSSPLYCLMWNPGEMTIGKTQPTLWIQNSWIYIILISS